MNGNTREQITKSNEKKFGTAAKKIKWERICIETKNSPDEPKSLITGIVDCIYPTGDVCFSKIESIIQWEQDKDMFREVALPEPYMDAKKINFRREIIAAVIYLKESDEESRID